MNEENEIKSGGTRNPRVVLETKIRKRYPNQSFLTEKDFYDALLNYHNEVCGCNVRLMDGQRKMADLFRKNPKMGALISDVVNGEDVLISCVRYFGDDIFDCLDDESKMERLREENQKYLARLVSQEKLQKQQDENWEESQTAIERFKQDHEMSEEEFELFMQKVYKLAEHIFMGEFDARILDILFKGLNYDTDLAEAEHTGLVRGRNERIVMERNSDNHGSTIRFKTSDGDTNEENLSPFLDLPRRPSVWDLKP